MTKYLHKSFSSAPATEAYRENFDRIFRGRHATQGDPAGRDSSTGAHETPIPDFLPLDAQVRILRAACQAALDDGADSSSQLTEALRLTTPKQEGT